MRPLDVLIVSERPAHLRTLIRILDSSSARVSASFTIRQAQQIFARHPTDLVFCDEYLSDGTYRELLFSIRFRQSPAGFILLLHASEWDEYMAAMRLGALDVLRCPLQQREVEDAILRALAHKEQHAPARVDSRAKEAAGLSQQDLLFQELLARAATALNLKDSPVPPAPSPAVPRQDDHCPPMVIRKDVA